MQKNRFLLEGSKFILVGAINTAIGYGCYALLVAIGLNFFVSSIFSQIVGTANSYLWNKYFTFKRKERSVSEILRFCAVYAVCFGVNTLILFALINGEKQNKYIAGVVALSVTTLISFLGHRFFSFKK